MSERPTYDELVDTLERIPGLYATLGAELDRPAPASSRGSGDKHRVPLNQQMLQMRLDIVNFAETYAHMIVEARDWNPPTTNVPGLIAGIVEHIGFFTESADPHLALDLNEEAETLIARARKVIDGAEVHKNRLGKCRETGCGGSYTLTWSEGSGTDDERLWRLRATAQTVKCDRDAGHQIEVRRLAVEA